MPCSATLPKTPRVCYAANPVRVDRFISNATDLSRNEVKRLVKNGLIEIDGCTVSDPGQRLGDGQQVTVDGAPIATPSQRYYMLNKPAGVVCANRDRDHTTAVELIYEHRADELQIAGRLDIDTTGLVLLTDDGQWNHRLTSPRNRCEKIYHASLAEPLSDPAAAVERFAKGIFLEGEKRRCKPAELITIDPSTVQLAIVEGKYHQVKRMFAALGNAVVALHRHRVGTIELDPALQPGDYRPLSADEIAAI